MSQKQFLILVGAGIFCALLFAAPGLYQLSKDYQRDKAPKEGSRLKWNEISATDKYQGLPPEARAEVKTTWFRANLLPEVEKRESLRAMGADKVYEWFMQQPDDNGQGYFTSFLGSLGRGAVAILPWCFDELASWQISPGFTEFCGSVRGSVESISPVNPIHADKWPMKLAFWLGFVAPPAAFFVIRARRKKKLTTAPPAPVLRAS
jgi:hypothetical protein